MLAGKSAIAHCQGGFQNLWHDKRHLMLPHVLACDGLDAPIKRLEGFVMTGLPHRSGSVAAEPLRVLADLGNQRLASFGSRFGECTSRQISYREQCKEEQARMQE